MKVFPLCQLPDVLYVRYFYIAIFRNRKADNNNNNLCLVLRNSYASAFNMRRGEIASLVNLST